MPVNYTFYVWWLILCMWISLQLKKRKNWSSWAYWTYGLQAPLRSVRQVILSCPKNEPHSLSSERNMGLLTISYILLYNQNCLLLFRPLASVSIKDSMTISLPSWRSFHQSLSHHSVWSFFISFHFLSTPKELVSLADSALALFPSRQDLRGLLCPYQPAKASQT